MTQTENQALESEQEQISERVQSLQTKRTIEKDTNVKSALRNILRDETGRKAAIALAEILGEPVGKRNRRSLRH